MAKSLINGEVLYFDARYIRVTHHDGISRFSAGLLAAIHETHEVVALISDEAQLALLPTGIDYLKLADVRDALGELKTPKLLNAAGAKLVYSPMQTMGSSGRNYKLALTLHDMIYYRHRKPPTDLSPIIRAGWWLFHLTYFPQRMVLNKADAVITVSETSKKLMLKHRLTKRPLSVVYNAGPNQSVTKPKKRAATNALVYMGSFMPYKNVETLIRAIGILPDFELRLLSKVRPDRKTELLRLAKGFEQRVKFLGGVTDDEYNAELDSAFALVTASFDEGFGIPLIEAMERATPVVASDMEIFREVGKNAASYFKADDASELVRAIEQLQTGDNWAAASAAGLSRSKDFNWKSSAQQLVAALEAI